MSDVINLRIDSKPVVIAEVVVNKTEISVQLEQPSIDIAISAGIPGKPGVQGKDGNGSGVFFVPEGETVTILAGTENITTGQIIEGTLIIEGRNTIL